MPMSPEIFSRIFPGIQAATQQARAGFPAVGALGGGQAYSRVAEAVGGGGAVAGAGAGMGAGGMNWLSKALGGGKVAQFAGGNWWWLLPIILGWMAGGQMKKYFGRQEVKAQTEHLRKTKEALSPEDMMYQAMMPEMERGNEMAQMMLLQQMMGGADNLGPQLATGEERIGGR